MREIGKVKYDAEQHSDVNMLLNFNLIDPVNLNSSLTYLWGRDTDAFPLLTLTEGQGLVSRKQMLRPGDTQFYWDIMTRRRVHSRIKSLLTQTTTPGINHGYIEVVMEDSWFIYQHTAIAPSGIQYRIQNEGIALQTGGYKYRFQNMSGDPMSYSPMSDFSPGAVWALGGSSIPTSKSDGNRSNNQGPSRATNQYGLYRFSKEISGNIANAVTNISFETEGGGSTNLWMPYEMRMWEFDRRKMIEEGLWFDEYNRDANGIIHLKDEKTGEFIPRGAGVRDILRAAGNYETYSIYLTIQRLKRIVSRIFDGRIDSTVDEIILYCGKGFSELFNDAILRDARLNNYFVTLGNEWINPNGDGWLSYGAYFNRYKMFNGKVLTVKTVDVFDHGIRAERDRVAGRMYNGYPLTSYTAVFLDHSMGDNGDRNIQMICEEGREYKVGIYPGMANLPGSWGSVPTNVISDTKDIASYEVLGSYGININNPTTSFWLELDPGDIY